LNGEAEEVLGCRGRIKLLKALMAAQRSGYAASISKLTAATRLKRWNVERHLEILLKLGWVEEVHTPEGRRFRLKENRKVEATRKLFKELGEV